MVQLNSLPFELHSMILDDCDFTTTRSYALAARATSSVANQHLYREIHLGPSGHITQWTCETVQRLLRTLIQRPDLAVCVRIVDLDITYTCDFVEEKRYLEKVSVGRANAEFTGLAKTIVEKLGLPDSRSWDLKLRHTSLDPWIALLLAQLTSMETLRLGPALLHISTFLSSMFDHLIRQHPGHFARIRSVSLGRADGGYKVAGLLYMPELYAAFFRLPCLEEFEMSLECFPKLGKSGFQEAPNSLTTFRLLRSGGITPEAVANLVTLTPNLETLHLGWNEIKEPFNPFIESPQINFAAVKSAINVLSQSLKSLTIDVTHYKLKTRHLAAEDDPTHPFFYWAQSSLGSLASLVFLEHLRVPVNVLMDHVPWTTTLGDVLPKALKTLILTDETLTWREGIFNDSLMPWEHSLSALVNLLGSYVLQHQRYAPQLISVALDFTAAIGSDGSVPEALEGKLRRVAEVSNITVEILYVQAYPLEHFTRLYPITITMYNRNHPEKVPWIYCNGPLTRVPLYWCPRNWSRLHYEYRFPMRGFSWVK
ncbi:hypothetical protein BJX64DRAFT_284665 [Aspergillus heterothallicus]